MKNYDYSQNGAYYITICTHGRKCLFGTVGAGSKPALNTQQPKDVPYSKPALNTQQPKDVPYSKPAIIKSPLMHQNEMGQLVEYTWNDLTNHIYGIELDEFVVMPNHIHGIVVINMAGLKRAGLAPARTRCHGLPEIVRQFKTFSARRINALRKTPGVPLWQRNYYEHIVRNEEDYLRIAEYIINNPLTWGSDENNSAFSGG